MRRDPRTASIPSPRANPLRTNTDGRSGLITGRFRYRSRQPLLGPGGRSLVAVEMKAPAGGTDLRTRGPRRAFGEVVPDMYERLVDADDVVTGGAAWGIHEAPLSLSLSHPRWSIGHAFAPSIRCRPHRRCEELLSAGGLRGKRPVRAHHTARSPRPYLPCAPGPMRCALSPYARCLVTPAAASPLWAP